MRTTSHSTFRRFPAPHTVARGGAVDSVQAAPLGHRSGDAADRRRRYGAFVSRLLKNRRPTAVLGGVRAVHVDAVDAVLRTRALAHVRKEVLEAGEPPPAHHDPAPAVVGEVGVPGIPGSLFHALPCVVLHGVTTPCPAVRGTRRTGPLALKTAATLSVTAPQYGRGRGGLSAADASASPTSGPRFRVFDAFNDGQPTELLSDQIQCSYHAPHCNATGCATQLVRESAQ